MEKMASTNRLANGVKLVGSIAGVASGLVAGTLGLMAVFKKGEMAIPLVTAGGVAGVVGMGGALASGVADIIKDVVLSKLVPEEAEHKAVRDILSRIDKNNEALGIAEKKASGQRSYNILLHFWIPHNPLVHERVHC